jgi:hypothetical protein
VDCGFSFIQQSLPNRWQFFNYIVAAKLKEAIHRTFGRRGAGDFPLDLPDPPESWKQPYGQLAMECGLEWPMDESIRSVAARLAEI